MRTVDAIDSTAPPPLPADNQAATGNSGSATAWTAAAYNAQQHNAAQGGGGQKPAGPPSNGTTTHVVAPGETLGELAARYSLPVATLAGANPAIRDPNLIHPGDVLTVPLGQGGGTLPAQHSVQPGETLGKIASVSHTSVASLVAANDIRDPNRIRAGQSIWVPGAGGTAAAKPAGPPASTPQAGAVDAAVHDLETARSALDAAKGNAAKSHDAGAPGVDLGPLQRGVDNAQTKLDGAVSTELSAKAGPGAAPDTLAKAGQGIVARYANDPAAQKLVSAAVTNAGTTLQAQAIVAPVQAAGDPVKALQALNTRYAKASPAVQAAVLADPDAGKILDAAARWANQPLTQQSANGEFPQAQTLQALQRLDHATQGLDKSLAGAVADRAAPGYQAFHNNPQNGGGPLVGGQGMTELMTIGGRIAGTKQGNEALQRFASTGAWNADSVQNAIGSGTDPAYAIALGRQIKASGQSPDIVDQAIVDGLQTGAQPKIAAGGSPQSVLDIAGRMKAAGLDTGGVVKVATDGVQQFKDKVTGDVATLAKHDAELAWLVQKDGAGMTPDQLNQAVAAYRTSKGAAWQHDEDALRQQIATDGSKLVGQMVALNQSAPSVGANAAADQTLKTIANDPAAGLAISTAIQSDPKLVAPGSTKSVADVFLLSKVGDIGRKFTNEMAAAYVRQNVLSKVQGINLQDPASVAQAKQAIQGMGSEDFARLIGVTPGDTKKAVAALDEAVNNAGTTPEQADAALSKFNDQINQDASLAKAFNKTTLAGQLLRGVGLAFAGVSLLNSANKYSANPNDAQNAIKLLADSAGFAQKNAELLVGLGAVDKESLLGQFGGEWKVAGRASAGDLIGGISVVLDSISAVRSGFGLGVPQDKPSAVFSATSAVGGGLTLAPAFGAAAWLGPAGIGTVAVSVIGNAVYQDVKSAHQYEGASRSFLKAAGYSDAAAQALSAQDGILSGATGSAQMPFLAKYAELKHMSPLQLRDWVNRLTPDQVGNLSKSLLQTAGDCHGDPGAFTAGPPQTEYIAGGDGFAVPITLANTVSAFESNLAYDHVPRP
jgi:LysM repeat protein